MALMLAFSTVSVAQERTNPMDDKDRTEAPDESRSTPTLSQTQGTVVVTSADTVQYIKQNEVQRPVDKTAKNQEEDVLSFHFLYYIIQKFKMSDLVDK